jgi:hypothetical protein
MMKTSKVFGILAITAVFILMLTAGAFAGKPAMTPAQHVQKIIQETIKYPEQARKDCCQGSVDVIFTVDDDGKINIENTFSTNPEIEKYVKEQLATICCKGVKTPFNEHYKVTISFKLIG